VQFREMLGKRKPKPRAFMLAADPAVDLTERFERFRDLVGCHADTGVAYGDGHAAIPKRDRDMHRTVLRRKFDGVGKEIDQNLPDAPIVGAYQRKIGVDRLDN